MAANTSISWADDTFNPWEGCQKVGPGCDNCYAEARNARYGAGVAPNWGPGAPRRRTSAANWRKPLKWDREQAALWAEYDRLVMPCDSANGDNRPDRETPAPRFVFCASLADVFDNAVPTEWRRDLFDLIRATPHLTWLLLTKRPGNICALYEEAQRLNDDGTRWTSPLPGARAAWPSNAAIGCSVVNQTEADREIPKLLAAKAALHPAFAFLSMEPLLGPVDLTRIPWRFNAMDPVAAGAPVKSINALTGVVTSWDRGFPVAPGEHAPTVDWVVAGGESGSKARPAHPEWFRDLRDQCAPVDVAFHFKQWGEWTPGEIAGPVIAAQTGAYVEDFSGDAVITRFSKEAAEGLHYDDEPDVWRVGKTAAGRRLDGALHDARPEVAR